LKKYIVFDRDGTLIKHEPYLYLTSRVKILPNVIDVIKQFREKGYILFLHTNQSGVGRGYYSIEDVIDCNNKMLDLIGLGDKIFEDICIADDYPPKKKSYRKPSIRFGLKILKKYKINRNQLYYIGDSVVDIETANNLKCNAIGVRTGEFDLKQKIKKEKNLKCSLFDDMKKILEFDL
tara:strand:- start:1578 stop:2111 length:534 start_codon:yes stop_codon:yes gene_type:complete